MPLPLFCRILLPLIVICFGCTPMAWTKPETDPAATKADVEQCWKEAHLRVGAAPLPQISSIPMSTVTPHGEVTLIATPVMIQSDAVQQAFEIMTNCMHQKGYKLEPAKYRQKN